jgi:CO/xanthine dehydrogenase FAD-binding subunit
MALPQFDYYTPKTVEEAKKLVSTLDHAEILAGGTWLLNLLKKSSSIKHVISLKHVAGLKGASIEGDSLYLGAAENLDDLSRNKLVGEHFIVLQKAINKLATPQIRNMATIGGNLCTCLPWADLACVLLALNAELDFAVKGKVHCVDFVATPKKYCTKDILVGITLPLAKADQYKFLRLPLRNETDIPFAALCLVETKKGKALSVNLGNSYPVLFNKTAAALSDKIKAVEAFARELKEYQKDASRLEIMQGLFKEFIADL